MGQLRVRRVRAVATNFLKEFRRACGYYKVLRSSASALKASFQEAFYCILIRLACTLTSITIFPKLSYHIKTFLRFI